MQYDSARTSGGSEARFSMFKMGPCVQMDVAPVVLVKNRAARVLSNCRGKNSASCFASLGRAITIAESGGGGGGVAKRDKGPMASRYASRSSMPSSESQLGDGEGGSIGATMVDGEPSWQYTR